MVTHEGETLQETVGFFCGSPFVYAYNDYNQKGYISLVCNFSELIRYKLKSIKKHDMRRTEILCPDCMKGKLLTSNEINANCDQCGEQFIITGKNSVRYKKPSDPSEQERLNSNV